MEIVIYCIFTGLPVSWMGLGIFKRVMKEKDILEVE
tara:strand:+ start:921 stop:1028 length:108 start_codon:yes stop_codon:yes gene_type:complete